MTHVFVVARIYSNPTSFITAFLPSITIYAWSYLNRISIQYISLFDLLKWEINISCDEDIQYTQIPREDWHRGIITKCHGEEQRWEIIPSWCLSVHFEQPPPHTQPPSPHNTQPINHIPISIYIYMYQWCRYHSIFFVIFP